MLIEQCPRDAAGIWETSRKHGAQVTDVQGAEAALGIDYPLMSTSERALARRDRYRSRHDDESRAAGTGGR